MAGMDTSATEDESADDDEVVQEFDVYLSKSLNSHLYLLQYPVLNAKRKYGARDRGTAKMKPQNNKIEMDVALDISSSNYDQSKGEQIALNVDGNAATMQASTVFETNVMDKQTLHSTTVPSAGKRYVSCVVQNGDVHLTPISHILQLRPSFKYMDRAEHRASQAAKAKAAGEADSSQDEVEEAKAVTVRLKGAETEAVRLARERSYAAYEKRVADEKWIQMRVHHKTDSFAERERQRLICQNRKQPDDKMGQVIAAFSEMVQTPSEYLTKLVPVYSEHAVDNSVIPNNILSLSLLKNETLGDQLKLLMKNAKVIHFTHLLSLLSDPPDENTIVRSLQSYALLVRGCWIVKSEVLFPPETSSPISGTPAENLCRSRDYILYMFTRKEYLVRKEVTSTVKIPGDDVKAILEDIAVMRIGHGWRLRLPPDKDFVKKFPEVCERQAMLWNAQGTKLAKQMNLTELITEIGTVSIKQEVTSPPRKKKGALPTEEKNAGKKNHRATAKRQRKSSGPKSSPVRPSVTSVKTEPVSPMTAMKVQTLSLMQPDLNMKSPSPARNIQSPHASPSNLPPVQTMLSPTPFVNLNSIGTYSQPPMVVNSFGALSPKINIAGVTSTVQSVASEMIKIGSPNHYFIPQMSIALPDAFNEGANTGTYSNGQQPAPMEQNQDQSNDKSISKINSDHES